MEIGEFSRQVGLSVNTLRYYEEAGFLTPQRTSGNHRRYTEADLKWVAFIKRLKLTGMPIREIKQYSDLREQGTQTIDARLELLAKQEARLQAQADQIQDNLDFVHQKMAIYRQMKGPQN